ncbi:hypothetical protein [Dethiosulfatarculus sandiegensis]|uniref:Uncharacterized protein n=1 Tax=Dethiosulfatarculus sandiegensis TaxID=1429043 RepID=A0A0D2J3S6_9BACT|nr:hypothetical protein [Dethiosulfatarculus sandiegensis]KIX12834.1 hypothetical protein X474_17130 [Dethiosulfatarculus sandiegensis]
MLFILYSQEPKLFYQKLSFPALKVSSQTKVEEYSNLEELEARLKKPLGNTMIALLVLKTPRELDRALYLTPLLADYKVILVLPELTAGQVGKALLLKPSYFTSLESDYSDLKAVLKKMLNFERKTSRASSIHDLYVSHLTRQKAS